MINVKDYELYCHGIYITGPPPPPPTTTTTSATTTIPMSRENKGSHTGSGNGTYLHGLFLKQQLYRNDVRNYVHACYRPSDGHLRVGCGGCGGGSGRGGGNGSGVT